MKRPMVYASSISHWGLRGYIDNITISGSVRTHMNDKNEVQKKDSAIKTLAIIGFTATVVFGVWLAVQVVQLTPAAFTSLASLAQDIYGGNEVTPLSVVQEKSVVNTGEQFTLIWDAAKEPGTFAITFSCVDGVIAKVRNTDGMMADATCDQPFPLSGTTAEVEIISAIERFVDVPYVVTFTKTDDAAPFLTDEERVTVVNAAIPQQGLVAGENTDTETPVVEETPAPEVVVAEPAPAPKPPTTPVVKPTPVVTKPTYTLTYPVSNPRGTIDLAMTFIAVGELSGSRFTERTELDVDDKAAVRFSVKNFGTKTTESWTYEVKLPNGETYESNRQAPLRPLEIATITIGFGLDSDDDGKVTITGSVDTDGDMKSSNDRFSRSVTVND
jgi:hypothetical protein